MNDFAWQFSESLAGVVEKGGGRCGADQRPAKGASK